MNIPKHYIRKRQIIEVVFTLLIVLLLWIIGSKVYSRVDLTTEKRYTLSEETKNVLRHLPDEIYVKVYLEGDLPAGFKKLRNAIKETLDEFRVYAGKNIQYEFINPSVNTDPKIRSQLFTDLYNKGLRPTNIMIRDEQGGNSNKLLFPSALVSYNGVEIPVNILKNNVGLPAEENLNNSMQTIEYELIKPIYNLTSKRLEKIAFLEGQDELNEFQVEDLSKELANSYEVDRGSINGKPHCLDIYKAVIVARPQKHFNEADKLILDQYIMQGGKVLWLVDAVNVNPDSLANGASFALINDINLDDMLFTYGVRINPTLIQDIQCNVVPVNTAAVGSQAHWSPLPWMYYPLIAPLVDHPISRNLNMISTRFPCNIDTVGANGNITKIPLLLTSPYTRLVNAPTQVRLDEIKQAPSRIDMKSGSKSIAVLLEGVFPSLYRNRSAGSILPGYPNEALKESKRTRMIVIADGELAQNDVRMTQSGPISAPLGYDKYTRQTFGNKDFILNCVQYLTDEAGLMSLRSKNLKLRLLDKERIREEKTKWQLVNTILPVLIVILFGIYYNHRRKIIYTK